MFDPRFGRDCRAHFRRCDVFLHTWSTLNAGQLWHGRSARKDDSSLPCVGRVFEQLAPSAVQVDEQPPGGCAVHGRIPSSPWFVGRAPGTRHNATGTSAAGLRCAAQSTLRAMSLRAEYEKRSGASYGLAVRLRPDLGGSDRRYLPAGVTMTRAAWQVLANATRRGLVDASTVYTCTRWHSKNAGGGAIGEKSADMCFWSAPPRASDALIRALDDVADEAIEANLCAGEAPERDPAVCDAWARRPDDVQRRWADGTRWHFWEEIVRHAALHEAKVGLGQLRDIDADAPRAA